MTDSPSHTTPPCGSPALSALLQRALHTGHVLYLLGPGHRGPSRALVLPSCVTSVGGSRGRGAHSAGRVLRSSDGCAAATGQRPEPHFHQLDVTDLQSIRPCATSCTKIGGLNVLVNNAGMPSGVSGWDLAGCVLGVVTATVRGARQGRGREQGWPEPPLWDLELTLP